MTTKQDDFAQWYGHLLARSALGQTPVSVGDRDLAEEPTAAAFAKEPAP